MEAPLGLGEGLTVKLHRAERSIELTVQVRVIYFPGNCGSHLASPQARIHTYRAHNCGQAPVTLNGHDHLPGPYGSAESRKSGLRRENTDGQLSS